MTIRHSLNLFSVSVALWVVFNLTGVYAEAPDFLMQTEQQLFARDFQTETTEERLSRIESVIFGQAQTGDTPGRQARIETLFAKHLVPKVTAQHPKQNTTIGPRLKDATNYPTVSQMEERLFQQTFTQEDIASRLSRLEKQVFRQSYDELPMVDRVDQLTLKVLPDSPLSVEEKHFTNRLPDRGEDLAPSSLAVYSQLTVLEEQVLGKAYSGELIATRLDRLETALMGAPQRGSIDSRVSQLNTHFARRAQTAKPFVGSPQAYTPQNPNAPLTSPYIPQQTMSGVMSTQPFSPEFLNMLPPHVRQRIEARGLGGVTGITPQIQQQRTQLFFGPGGWTQKTEIYVPNTLTPQQSPHPPSSMPFPGSALGPLYQNQLPTRLTPATSSQYNQAVTLLETQVFGRQFPEKPFLTRLNELEQQVFGKTYPQYPYQQRIQRLQTQAGFRQS